MWFGWFDPMYLLRRSQWLRDTKHSVLVLAASEVEHRFLHLGC
jgi:hypothetical protein